MNMLMKAARDGDLKALKRALNDPQIDPNAKNEKTGLTALHIATIWNNKSCLHLLLNNSQVNDAELDNAGRKARDIALEGSNLDSVKVFSKSAVKNLVFSSKDFSR